MPKVLQALVRVCVLTAFLCSSSHAVIYGQDDRRFIGDAANGLREYSAKTFLMGPPIPGLQPNAVAVNISNRVFSHTRFGEDLIPLCENEIGRGLPSRVWGCSGGIIGAKRILTAGHCFAEAAAGGATIFRDAHRNKVKNMRFNFVPADVHDVNRWEIVNRWSRRPQGGLAEQQDYAIATLMSPVVNGGAFTLANAGPAVDDVLSLIGHPMGLPWMSREAKIYGPTERFLLLQGSNTYAGDSGSLQFNAHGQVNSVFVSGMEDFFIDRTGATPCSRSFVCPRVPIDAQIRNGDLRPPLTADQRRCHGEKSQRINEPAADNARLNALTAMGNTVVHWDGRPTQIADEERATFSLDVANEHNAGEVVLVMRLFHQFSGDWRISLSHGGRTVILQNPSGTDNTQGYVTRIFSSNEWQGLAAQGRYTVTVADLQARHSGAVFGISLYVMPEAQRGGPPGGLRPPPAEVPGGVNAPKELNAWVVAPCKNGELHCTQPSLDVSTIEPHLGYPVGGFSDDSTMYLGLAKGQQASDFAIPIPSHVVSGSGETVLTEDPMSFHFSNPVRYAVPLNGTFPYLYRLTLNYQYGGKKQIAVKDLDIEINPHGFMYDFVVHSYDSAGHEDGITSGVMNVLTGTTELAPK